MVFFRDLERIQVDPGGVIVLVACRVTLTPGGKRFPTERNNDLFPPGKVIRLKPLFLLAHAIGIKAEFPWTVQIDPVVSFDRAALKVRARIFWTWKGS